MLIVPASNVSVPFTVVMRTIDKDEDVCFVPAIALNSATAEGNASVQVIDHVLLPIIDIVQLPK